MLKYCRISKPNTLLLQDAPKKAAEAVSQAAPSPPKAASDAAPKAQDASKKAAEAISQAAPPVTTPSAPKAASQAASKAKDIPNPVAKLADKVPDAPKPEKLGQAASKADSQVWIMRALAPAAHVGPVNVSPCMPSNGPTHPPAPLLPGHKLVHQLLFYPKIN